MDLLQSFMFVPADSPRKMASAKNLRPDAFIYDLEDAVAPDKKAEARSLLIEELKTLGGAPAKIFVRVNAAGSPYLEDDLLAAVRPPVYGVVLPKCSAAADVARIDAKISALEREMKMPEGGLKLILMIESAKGVACAGELARSSPRAVAFLFGGEDFSADMGIQRTKGGEEIAFARFLVALAAHSEGLFAIDGPFVDFKDPAGLADEMRRVKQIGFSGKALIHPGQIEVLHAALAPSADEVALAQEIVAAFEASGGGVTSVRGKMIDGPVVVQAKRILQQAARK